MCLQINMTDVSWTVNITCIIVCYYLIVCISLDSHRCICVNQVCMYTQCAF